MARPETWNLVKPYFKPDSKIDRWGDPDALQDAHLLRLYDFRRFIGCPIYVTAGVKTSGHSKRSFHYKRIDDWGNQIGACATDVVIPDYPHSPFDLVLDATRFGFTGIGYYPHWKFSGITVGGLHLDSRPLGLDEDGSLDYGAARWMGVPCSHGKQKYIALTFTNLLKHTKHIDDSGIGSPLH